MYMRVTDTVVVSNCNMFPGQLGCWAPTLPCWDFSSQSDQKLVKLDKQVHDHGHILVRLPKQLKDLMGFGEGERLPKQTTTPSPHNSSTSRLAWRSNFFKCCFVALSSAVHGSMSSLVFMVLHSDEPTNHPNSRPMHDLGQPTHPKAPTDFT